MIVLLAIDDSEYSRAAREAVVAQFSPKNAVIHVLHVVEPIAYYLTESLQLIESVEAAHAEAMRRGKQLVESAQKELSKAGFQVFTHLAEGDPRRVIVDSAGQQKADVIVMGSHGRTGWKRMMLGSVSEAVAQYAPCSVLIVRLPGGKPAQSA
jgi:nucleotide-binding universal stress UspA family protein